MRPLNVFKIFLSIVFEAPKTFDLRDIPQEDPQAPVHRAFPSHQTRVSGTFRLALPILV